MINKNTGDRSQESEYRIQETEVRSQNDDKKKWEKYSVF